ncbi:unnamed protein product [Strongylus vulgaris]|uniref:Uncharacterized protein n=1 Tax=Strongylus vulgaris TaxID=40348 RepID=A0A3P7IZA2_STRVU|nr:unnamed protein product [Strongylus vulgaris]
MTPLYCEPKLRDFGLADHGWRGFGGIVSNLKTGKIPQYNLAAFWERPIAPILTGYAEHALRRGIMKTAPRRPPGSVRADLDARMLTNINMLAASCGNSRDLYFWTVSGESGRHMINEYITEVEDGVLLSEGNLRNQFASDNPVMEGSVRSFEECKLLPGDIALCDTAGMVWSGVIGSPLSRAKSATNESRVITYSDHPRVVFVASTYHVKSLDLRLSSANTVDMFDVPELAKSVSFNVS